MDRVRSQTWVSGLRTVADRRRPGGGMAPRRDIAAEMTRTSIAGHLDRRDDRRHASAMRRTHPRQPAG